MKGFEYIARTLNEYGVTHVFFQEVALRFTQKEFIQKYGRKTVLAHNEIAAAYMADGYARASGRVGVCLAQSIGAANLAAGLADAKLAGIPIIAITGKKDAYHQYKNCYQELDHNALFGGSTKFQGDIVEPNQLPFLLRQSFKEATSNKPSPVHLDILSLSGSIAELWEIAEPSAGNPVFGQYPPYRPAADAQSVAVAAKAIADAKKPVLVVGRGAIISGAYDEIYKLAKKADIPIVTTPDGKTIINENDDLWAGIVGGYGMACANKTVSIADLVIFIGTQASDQTTNDWNTPGLDTKVIQIDIDPQEVGKIYTNSIGLLGDAKVVVGQIEEAVCSLTRSEWRKEVSGYLNDYMYRHLSKLDLNSTPIKTERLCFEISKAMPDNAILVADTGYSTIWSACLIRMKKTQKYIRAAGSLGWALAASLGVKCGAPDRPVICFIGDGGFYSLISEMETAIRNNINTVTVINNNSMLSQCEPSISRLYNDNVSSKQGAKMITFEPVNFTKIAEGFGLYAIRVTKPEDIKDAIMKAINSGRPALVEVMTDGTGNNHPWPAVE